MQTFFVLIHNVLQKISKDDQLYDLYAVIVHTGIIHGGHYYAYVNTTRRQNAQQWDQYLKVSIDEALMMQEIKRNQEGDRSTKEAEEHSPKERKRENKEIEEKLQDVEPNWYYVSDQTIKKTTEKEVMNDKDAYVLFYEAHAHY